MIIQATQGYVFVRQDVWKKWHLKRRVSKLSLCNRRLDEYDDGDVTNDTISETDLCLICAKHQRMEAE